jgi:predicted porin
MKRIDYLNRRLTCAAGASLLLSLSTAHAQSSVTLYGQLDAGVLYTNKTIDPATGQNAGKQVSQVNSGLNPSFFGVRGKEDLGGGMAAIFNLQSGISLANGGFDNSNGGLFGRLAWVGLESDYGTVRLGLQFSPFEDALFETDPRTYSQFVSNITVYANNAPTGIFVSNAVSYVSPKIAGFTGRVMMALGGVAGDFSAGRLYSASLKYDLGGLLVNAAIINEADHPSVLSSEPFTTPLTARTIGAAYTFNKISVRASFANYNSPLRIDDNVRSGGDNNVYNVGFDISALPDISFNGSVYLIHDQHDSASHTVMGALGATYFLSSRTSLYAQVGVADNHGTENIGLALDGAADGVRGTTVGANVGITHNF